MVIYVRILAEHVIKHWTVEDFRLFLRVVRPFLARRGRIRIAVPDGYHHDPGYLEWVRPGGTGVGADDHKIRCNYVSISRVLSEERYSYNLLKYFDQAGNFHHSQRNVTDGPVTRSADFDPRNKESPLSYRILIVNAWQDGAYLIPIAQSPKKEAKP